VDKSTRADKSAIREDHRRRRLERRADGGSSPTITARCWDVITEAHRTSRGGAITAVAAFQPMRHEPDLRPLTQWLLEQGLPVYLPRMHDDDMEWVRAGSSLLAQRPARVPAPPGIAQPLPGDSGTVVLVPALAIDPGTGLRLGYGAGNYDRFLSGRDEPFRVGVCFDDELRELTGESHDIPVEAIVTPARVLQVGSPGHRGDIG